MKLASCKSALNPPVVCSTDRSKAVVPVLALLFVALWFILRGDFLLCLTLCHFVLVFFSPFSIAITSLGEERANLSAFRTLVRFVLVWICRFPLPLGVWEGLRFVIVALPGLFSYLFFFHFGENPHFRQDRKIPDFHNRSYSDISCKYQYIEKPLKDQRRLGLHFRVLVHLHSKQGSEINDCTIDDDSITMVVCPFVLDRSVSVSVT